MGYLLNQLNPQVVLCLTLCTFKCTCSINQSGHAKVNTRRTSLKLLIDLHKLLLMILTTINDTITVIGKFSLCEFSNRYILIIHPIHHSVDEPVISFHSSHHRRDIETKLFDSVDFQSISQFSETILPLEMCSSNPMSVINCLLLSIIKIGSLYVANEMSFVPMVYRQNDPI